MNGFCGGDRNLLGRLGWRDALEVGGDAGGLEASVGEGLILGYRPRRQYEPGTLDMVLLTEDMKIVKNDAGQTLKRMRVVRFVV
jgi:hypothetical protein